MKSIIYYFSGTGNSLDVARKIGAALKPQAEIISIANSFPDANIQSDAEIVGFVFPVLMGDAPWVVKEFVKKMQFATNPYIFAVATCNDFPRNCLPIFSELLKTRSQVLALGELIVMPGSGLISSPEVNGERLKASVERCLAVAQKINSRMIEHIPIPANLSVKTILGSPRKKLNMIFTRFKVSRACVGCGICQKICPMATIMLQEKRPVWGNHCVACLACFHWCPEKAITFRTPVLGNRPRYHHPDIHVKDIAMQQAQLYE